MMVFIYNGPYIMVFIYNDPYICGPSTSNSARGARPQELSAGAHDVDVAVERGLVERRGELEVGDVDLNRHGERVSDRTILKHTEG